MLPPNLLLVWTVLFLSTTVSSAPVEEKEAEEVEAAEEGEGELSEEEEDEDDSQSQDRIEGAPGIHQTSSASGSGVSGAHSTAGAKQDGPAGGDTASAGSPGSLGSPGSPGSADPLGSLAVEGSLGSAAGDPPAGEHPPSHLETHGSDGADSETNGNGHKFLNGGSSSGGGGGAYSQTGDLASYGYGGGDYTDYTGGGLLRPDGAANIEDHMTPPTQPHSRLPAGAAPSHLAPAAAHRPDFTPDLGSYLSGPASGSAHSAGGAASSSSSSSSHGDAAGEQPDGEPAVPLGNGRLTHLTDLHTALTDRPDPVSDLHLHLTDGVDSVTSFHGDLTASGLGLGHDVTESSPMILHSESVDATHMVSGVYSHRDLVTMATEHTGTNTAAADWTGIPPDSSRPASTEYTPGSVTEQYLPSGQGAEGAENVELEDTC